MKETGSPQLLFENLEARASVMPSTPPERSSGGIKFHPHTHFISFFTREMASGARETPKFILV